MKKRNTLILAVLFVVIFFSNDAFSQGFGNLDGISFDDDVNDEPVPIFGHLFLIITAFVGSIIGYKKLKK